jgi:agmatine deiminase
MSISPASPQANAFGSLPAADAFYMPADAYRLARLWLAWEARPDVNAATAALARAAADFQPVTLLTSQDQERNARAACGEGVDIQTLPASSARLRDTGPTFLVDGKGGAAAVDWRFNGWGTRGDTADAELAHALLGAAEVRRFRAPLTLEGSSLSTDGSGTFIVLGAAIFDPKRNPRLSKLEAFGIFQNWLGAARVIWLDRPHPNDPLQCDARALAVFAKPGVVMITAPEGEPVLSEVAERLARTQDASGATPNICRLPAVHSGMVTSYTNVVPVNGGLLVPAFDAGEDARACDILAELFSDRTIRPVPALSLASAGIPLSSVVLPQPARLLERSRATVLPRSAWSQPTSDAEELLQHYIDLADREG